MVNWLPDLTHDPAGPVPDLLLVPSGLVAAYYLVWAVARVAGLQDTKRPAPPARHRIRIVIPADDMNRIRCPRH